MTELARLAAIIEYDGTAYEGLQWQPTGPTIQREVERAAAAFGVDRCRFKASGRTDSGVHARGQAIALDLPASVVRGNPVSALNWHLPEDIRVRRAIECSEDFDPRGDARRRTYRYLLSGGQPRPAIMRNYVGRVRMQLDLDRMRAAAEVLTGEHDFRAWRSSICQAKRTVLTIQSLTVEPWRDRAAHGGDWQVFEITVSCRSFLHRMVRFLVGGIARVGGGELSAAELSAYLERAELPPRVVPADACGLSLERVEFADGRDPFVGSLLPGEQKGRSAVADV